MNDLRAEQIFENVYKKLKKGDTLTDHTTLQKITPLQVLSKEPVAKDLTISSLFAKPGRNASNGKTDSKRLPNDTSLNKNVITTPGKIANSQANRTRSDLSCKATQPQVDLLGSRLDLLKEVDIVSGNDKIQANEVGEEEEEEEEEYEEELEYLNGSDTKRKRGRPKGSKKPVVIEKTFSQAISNVVELIDLEHVPRELKKIMTMSDIRRLNHSAGSKLTASQSVVVEAQERSNGKTVKANESEQSPLVEHKQSPLETQPTANASSQQIEGRELLTKMRKTPHSHQQQLQSRLPMGEELLKSLSETHRANFNKFMLTNNLDRVLPSELHTAYKKILDGQEENSNVGESTNATRINEDEQSSSENKSAKNGFHSRTLKKDLFTREANSGEKSEKLVTHEHNTSLVIPEEAINKAWQYKTRKSSKKALKNGTSTQVANIDKLKRTTDAISKLNEEIKYSKTYINCDLRYFNMDFLVDKLGSFDGKPSPSVPDCQLLATLTYRLLFFKTIFISTLSGLTSD